MRCPVSCHSAVVTVLALLLAELPAAANAQRPATKNIPGAASRLQARVWVNLTSGIYHCPASRFYGDGRSGEYMKEAQARAAGYRAASRRGCDDDGDTRRVWVNGSSKVYHCPGSARYADTKGGRYMSEVGAVAQGYRPAGGRKCN